MAKDKEQKILRKSPKQNSSALMKEGKKEKFPTHIKPMLATLVNAPFDSPEWTYEVIFLPES